MSVKIPTKHASYSLVTFVTHKRFAVLFFLPSCCVNSLMVIEQSGVQHEIIRVHDFKIVRV